MLFFRSGPRLLEGRGERLGVQAGGDRAVAGSLPPKLRRFPWQLTNYKILYLVLIPLLAGASTDNPVPVT